MLKDHFNSGNAKDLLNIIRRLDNNQYNQNDDYKAFQNVIVPTSKKADKLIDDASSFLLVCNERMEEELKKKCKECFVHAFSYPADYKHISRSETLKILRSICEEALNTAKRYGKYKVYFTSLRIMNPNIKGKNAKATADNLMQACYKWLSNNRSYVMNNRSTIYFYVEEKYLQVYKDARDDISVGISDDSLAIVLPGGGANGALQIGAWNVLETMNITSQITGFSGTSVGALNEFIFASRIDAKERESIWRDFPPDLNGDKNQRAITRAIKDLLDNCWHKEYYDELCHCHDMYLTVDYLEDHFLSEKVFERYKNWKRIPYEDISYWLRCSSKHPVIYSPGKVMDGGVGNISFDKCINNALGNNKVCYDDTNIPIQPLYDIGYRHFIIIYTGFCSDKLKRREAERYPDAIFYRLYPPRGNGNLVDADEGMTIKRIERGETMTRNFFEYL